MVPLKADSAHPKRRGKCMQFGQIVIRYEMAPCGFPPWPSRLVDKNRHRTNSVSVHPALDTTADNDR